MFHNLAQRFLGRKAFAHSFAEWLTFSLLNYYILHLYLHTLVAHIALPSYIYNTSEWIYNSHTYYLPQICLQHTVCFDNLSNNLLIKEVRQFNRPWWSNTHTHKLSHDNTQSKCGFMPNFKKEAQLVLIIMWCYTYRVGPFCHVIMYIR